jgi:hypothetical protein
VSSPFPHDSSSNGYLTPLSQSAMLDDSKTHAERSCGPNHRKKKHVDVLRELWKLRYGRLICSTSGPPSTAPKSALVTFTNQPFHQCIHNPSKASTKPVRGTFDFRLLSTSRHLRHKPKIITRLSSPICIISTDMNMTIAHDRIEVMLFRLSTVEISRALRGLFVFSVG